MIRQLGLWFGFTLIRLGWHIYGNTFGFTKSYTCQGLSVERKHITYSINFDREWEKKQRKAKLEQEIKKHEEKIKRLQYEIDFELR